MSAPLQNHSLNGSMECKEQPLGTWSSGGLRELFDGLGGDARLLSGMCSL